MKLSAKTTLQLALIAMLFQGNPSFVSAQTSGDDIAGGSSVFVFERAEKSPAFGVPQQQRARKNKRRPVIKKKSTAPPAQQTSSNSGGKKPPVVEPIAPDEWINEAADAAIEERKIADDEPLLFLSEGFLNSQINGCTSPEFPAPARRAKLKKVRLKALVTIGKYGGVLDAKVIDGDPIFRTAVYKSLESMSFRQTYFMGEPVRIQGLIELVQHDGYPQKAILCKERAMGERIALEEAKLPSVIDGDVLNERAKTCESPEFPAEAKAAGLKSVEAKIQIVVDEKGNVVSAKPIDGGHPAFNQAAVKAAMKATFPRSYVTQEPVKVKGIMIFTQNPNNNAPCKPVVAEKQAALTISGPSGFSFEIERSRKSSIFRLL